MMKRGAGTFVLGCALSACFTPASNDDGDGSSESASDTTWETSSSEGSGNATTGTTAFTSSGDTGGESSGEASGTDDDAPSGEESTDGAPSASVTSVGETSEDASTTTGTTSEPEDPPTIDSFATSVTSLPGGGGRATLSWSVSGADEVRIEPDIGAVEGGSVEVDVSRTTTFTLVATNGAGETTRSRTITVATRGELDTGFRVQFGTASTDWPRAIATDSAGNVIVAGGTFGALDGTNRGSVDVFVAKYASTGAEIWTRQYGTTASEAAWSIEVAPDDTVYVLALSDESVPDRILRYSSDGDLDDTWDLDSADVSRRDLAMGPGGELYSVGYTSTESHIFGYSPAGAERIVATFENQASEIATDSAGDLYVTANGIFVARYTPEGDLVWDATPGDAYANVYGIAVTDERVYVTGTTGNSAFGTNAGQFDAYILQLSTESGEELEGWQFGSTTSEFGAAVAVDDLDNAYVAGGLASLYSSGYFSEGGAFVSKIDHESGAQDWRIESIATLGRTRNDDGGMGITVTPNGYVYVTGQVIGEFAHPSAGESDAFIARIR